MGKLEGFLLATASLLGNSSCDVLKKKLSTDGKSATEMVTVMCSAQALAMLPAAMYFGWLLPLSDLSVTFWETLLISVIASLGGTMLSVRAIKMAGIALSVPFITVNPAFALIMSSIFNGENISLQGTTGVLIVTAGAFSLAWSSRPAANTPAASNKVQPEVPHPDPVASAPSDEAPGEVGEKMPLDFHPTQLGALAMIMAAFLWSTSACAEKRAITETGVVHFLVMEKVFMTAAMLLLSAFQRLGRASASKQGSPTSRSLGYMVLLGVLDLLAVGAFFLSMQHIYVSFSLAMKRGGATFLSSLTGFFLFHEQVSRGAVVAICVMVVGVVTIVSS